MDSSIRSIWFWFVISCLAIGCPSPSASAPCGWTQWGHDAAHSGQACAEGQPLSRALATVVFDPFADLERADSQGALTAHFQAPLVLGDDVYMELKGGTYVPCSPTDVPCGPDSWNQESWNETHSTWKNGTLTRDWIFQSDWKPEPAALVGWEPVFHPALFGDLLYVPGLGGTVHKVDRHSGQELSLISPQRTLDGGAVDPNAYVAGPLTIDAAGDVLYDLLWLDPVDPVGGDARGWLVRVAPDDSVTLVSFAALVPGAPGPDDDCATNYQGYRLPYPHHALDGGALTPVPTSKCLSQRPGVNVAPAVAADGTIYTVSRAHGAKAYAYLVAVNPDLTPKWATSMRDVLHDGCGVSIPADAVCPYPGDIHLYGLAFHCCSDATPGVDPYTNLPPAGEVDDSSSSSPVALPDGTVLFGAIHSYNLARGHLYKFASSGEITGTFDFGWDVTPAFSQHDGTYSIITKNNHYYTDYAVQKQGPFYISRLAPDLSTAWNFGNTNTRDCARQPDGGVQCSDQTCHPEVDGGMVCPPLHPDGFEWCVNAPAVDPKGVAFANSEDGSVYAINSDGKLRDSIFLLEALGAAYTPISIDGAGRVYSLNAGTMTVVGK